VRKSLVASGMTWTPKYRVLKTFYFSAFLVVVHGLYGQIHYKGYQVDYNDTGEMTGMTIWFKHPLKEDSIHKFYCDCDKTTIRSIKKDRTAELGAIEIDYTLTFFLQNGDTIEIGQPQLAFNRRRAIQEIRIKGKPQDSLLLYTNVRFSKVYDRLHGEHCKKCNFGWSVAKIEVEYPHGQFHRFRIRLPKDKTNY
jgi:hypothetical protein